MKAKVFTPPIAVCSLVLVVGLVATLGATGCSQSQSGSGTMTASQAKPIALGWMTSWATTAQIMQALQHTNIAQLYDVPIQLKSFLFGPNINEAAMHNEVDCTNSGLVPTISLLAASDDWVVVGKLIEFPLCTLSRTEHIARDFSGLKGRTIGVPFGGGSHPYVLKRIKECGLTMGKGIDDVHVINLKPGEQALAMEQGKVDAVGTWEPQTAIILQKQVGDKIDTERHLGVIAVRKSLADSQPEKVIKLLECYMQANLYVAQHREQTDAWYAEAAHLDSEVVPLIKVIEPNTKATSLSEVSLYLNEEDLKLAQTYCDIMFEAELIAKKVDFGQRTNLTYLNEAMARIKSEPQKTPTVK